MPCSSRQAAVLAIILVSYFMILLDNSVIFTGLPSIRADLDLSATELAWVQDAHTKFDQRRAVSSSTARSNKVLGTGDAETLTVPQQVAVADASPLARDEEYRRLHRRLRGEAGSDPHRHRRAAAHGRRTH